MDNINPNNKKLKDNKELFTLPDHQVYNRKYYYKHLLNKF